MNGMKSEDNIGELGLKEMVGEEEKGKQKLA
jgi:hypothetical protein